MKKSILINILKVPRYIYYFIKCLFIFKNPFSIIFYYIRRMTPEKGVIELRNGLRLFLSDHPHDIITVFVVFVKKDYGQVKRNSTVVDIGANIGIFSIYAANKSAKKIYAYEPNRQAYEVLLKNISNNGFENIIFPYNLAVFDRDDDKVAIPLRPSPYNEIKSENITDIENSELVYTITLCTIVNQNLINQVDLLKIDCEGAEYRILFNTNSLIFSSIIDIRLEYHEGPVERLISYLQSNNYRLVCHKHDSAVLWVTSK